MQVSEYTTDSNEVAPKSKDTDDTRPSKPLKTIDRLYTSEGRVFLMKDANEKSFIAKYCSDVERELIEKFQHPSIIKCVDLFKSNQRTFVLMKHMGKGSLKGAQIQTYAKLQSVLKQVTEGINYINEQGYVYSDLKTANVLVDDDDTIQVRNISISNK